MNFYFKSGILSFFLGLTTVMLIYGIGIGSSNSKVCREQYNYSVERYGYSCRLLGFPTSYIENDVWGHNAHVYPVEFGLNVLIWSVACCALLVLLRNYLPKAFEAVSTTNKATRSAIILELFAGPLIFLILVTDMPVRQGDLFNIFFRTFNHWGVLYFPIPIITLLGILLGTVGLFRKISVGQGDGSATEGSRKKGVSRRIVLYLPFLIAMWTIIAMMFVAWIPEVV
jgi:hypothetical protein